MIELELARHLEGMHLAALRIDAGHHVLDHAVLSRRVERLQDDEDGVRVVGVEPLLQGRQSLHAFGEQRLGVGLVDVDPTRVVGLDIGKPEIGAFANAIAFEDFGGEHRSTMRSARSNQAITHPIGAWLCRPPAPAHCGTIAAPYH